MCGSATLAIVVSTPCMKVASMIETVIQPRFGTGAGVTSLTAPLFASGRPTSHANIRSMRSSHGRWNSVSTSTVTLSPAASGWFGSSLSKLSRTGRRWTTLTQLPVAFSAGSSEKVSPVPGLKLCTLAGNTTSG